MANDRGQRTSTNSVSCFSSSSSRAFLTSFSLTSLALTAPSSFRSSSKLCARQNIKKERTRANCQYMTAPSRSRGFVYASSPFPFCELERETCEHQSMRSFVRVAFW